MLTQEQKTKIVSLLTTGLRQHEIAKLVGVNVCSVRNVIKTRKRILVISDLHCGHMAGLTPPPWWREADKFYEQNIEIWSWYSQTVGNLKADVAFIIGDLIDGKGKRSGGTEQITSSFHKQLQMAKTCINMTGVKSAVAVYGTPYHTGVEEDFEGFLHGLNCDFKIGGHEFPKVYQIQFDLKHKIGSSSIPHGRFTSLAKTKLWNQLWEDIDGQPKSDVIIRGHTHYFDYCGDNNFLAMICPALSGWGSKYGVRQCDGIVNTGLLWFDVYDGTTLNNLQWYWDIPNLKTQKVEVYEL